MRLGTLWVELQCLSTRGIRALQIRFAAVPVHVEKRAAVGDACVRPREVRINFDGAIEHASRVLQSHAAKLKKELATAQIVLVSLNILRRRLLNGAFVVLTQ